MSGSTGAEPADVSWPVPAGPPARIRPSRLWYLIAAVILVLGIGAGLAFLFFALRPALGPMEQFSAGQPQRIELGSTRSRTLYLDGDFKSLLTDIKCHTAAGESGVRLIPVAGALQVTNGSGTWYAIYQIDVSRSGTYEITCETEDGRPAILAVGPRTGLRGLFLGVAGAVVCPMASFLAAALIGLIVAIRRHSAKRRLTLPS